MRVHRGGARARGSFAHEVRVLYHDVRPVPPAIRARHHRDAVDEAPTQPVHALLTDAVEPRLACQLSHPGGAHRPPAPLIEPAGVPVTSALGYSEREPRGTS